MLCTWKCIEFEFMLDMLMYKAMDGSSSFICTLILHFVFIPFRANYHHFLMNVLGERANVLRCKWMQLMACEGISQYIAFMQKRQHCIAAIEMHRSESVEMIAHWLWKTAFLRRRCHSVARGFVPMCLTVGLIGALCFFPRGLGYPNVPFCFVSAIDLRTKINKGISYSLDPYICTSAKCNSLLHM